MTTLSAYLGTGGNNQPLVVYEADSTFLMTCAQHLDVSKNLAYALAARDYKNPPVVTGKMINTDQKYIVRKLTPTECARLQGFPDWWCSDLGTKNPTDEEINYWKEVYKDHAQALGKTTKPKTDNQIRKWLKDPYSASAEYKMWGNGVALPCVYFVMAGIEYVDSLPLDELNAAPLD